MSELPRTPSFRLDGRRAVITGGGRGIGFAAATALAEAGAEVILVARSRKELDAKAGALRDAGYKAAAHVVDALDVDATERELGRLAPFAVLVNNAGTNRPKSMADVTVEDYGAVMDLNIRAAYFVARTVACGMVGRRHPRLDHQCIFPDGSCGGGKANALLRL
jgi:NAD(P)-dependent dehydrogenase (short-subunit alcohol dehydrogenase family)